MKRADYKPRIIDSQIERALSAFGALCVEGPKWCGKTWTCSQHANSEIFLGDPSGNFQNRRLAEMSPGLILDGERPRLIDEWQEVPPVWDAVRHAADQTKDKGLFLLTGSSTPNRKGILHSGAGRIARIRMRPMSLFESGDSSGEVSLRELCEGRVTARMTGEKTPQELIHLIIRGGWPASVGLDAERAALLPAAYIDAILNDNVERIDGVRRDTRKMGLLLRSLARNESTTASNRVLMRDIREADEVELDADTVATYLEVFRRLFLIDDQPPFAAGIRSSVRVKQAEKRHLCDPSLACALLKATPEMLLGDLETLGFLFEALCERDLRIYAQSFGAELFHYQDYKGRKIDAVIQLPDASWAAFEIKLGANQIDAAAEGLLSLQREIAADPKGKPPKTLCVLCGLSSAAYQRPDGVFVVPITALRE